ncbi:MAG TPA: NADH-quinone oxidoreductase subunit M [Rectinemataceae bacterium]|nr:NADH-quinone oxidoreductase subunit M [Rectinemataceae bacterium]
MVTLLLILLPLVGGLLVMALRESAARAVASIVALATALVAIGAAAAWGSGAGLHYGLSLDWIPSWGISFSLGLDGLSLPLVLLTVLVAPVALILATRNEGRRSPILYGLILAMEAGLVGVFAARDAVVFYLFWELALVPVYFIAGFWGGEKRVPVTLKFLVYTVAGSLFMLFGILYVHAFTAAPQGFSLSAFYSASLPPGAAPWILAAFAVAFAIKMPLFPFHTWQSDTYHEAPASGSLLLAALMAKMGLYGVMRWMLPVFPTAFAGLQPLFIALGVVGVVWGSLVALAQKDMKRLLAWSSFSHTGLMAAGVFSLGIIGFQGGVLQMVAHGLSIAGLFLAVDIFESRTGGRQIGTVGGLAHRNGAFAVLFVLLALSAFGLPLTAGFAGEFLLLISLSKVSLWWALGGGIGVILGAVLYLQWIRKSFLGPEPKEVAAFKLKPSEAGALGVLALAGIVLGVYPKPLLELARPTLDALLNVIGAR